MWLVENEEQIAELERDRSLVGTFVHHCYDFEKVDWILQARRGLNADAGPAMHLLIPFCEYTNTSGYAVDSYIPAHGFNVELSNHIIRMFGISFADLPAIVFRFTRADYYFVKLGGLSKEELILRVGEIVEVAKIQYQIAPHEHDEFQKEMHRAVINHLRAKGILSALHAAAPAIAALIGGGASVASLVKGFR